MHFAVLPKEISGNEIGAADICPFCQSRKSGKFSLWITVKELSGYAV
jgi:hypothetical protein